ncbi:MAG: glycosyltransferase family 2 protein [Candidatus Electrothrix sp. GW3-4]|uniref:glycosyltransferase family 2 protein n=1 Tax=Candidatus Electrothrix sp. GW3-4 TaxID=3126740 RepID=UPI0030CD9F64
MGNTMVWLLFWVSFGLLLYSFIGFPLLVFLRGTLAHSTEYPPYTPTLTLIIAAYNEAPVIRQKLENTFSLDYPSDSLEVVVASDGSDDETVALVQQYQDPRVKLLSLPRQGKNLTLNAAVETASGEILVFTDADTMIAPDALRHLTAPFSDPKIGGVAGDYRHAAKKAEAAGERNFWSFERLLKRLQSRAGSITSAWGPIYAIRKSLFVPIPIGVTDDFFISVQSLVAHQRLIFEPQAVATGPVANSAGAEFQRKVRIITAGLRAVWQTRTLLNPFKYGFLSLQIFSHKVLRRLMGFPLLILMITAPMLWTAGWFYQIMTLCQIGLHGAAMFGFLLQRRPIGQSKVLRLPFFLDLVYVAAAFALFNLFRGTRHDIWVPQHNQ